MGLVGVRAIPNSLQFNWDNPPYRAVLNKSCGIPKYGICAQQLTQWRRAARSGRLALVTDDAAEFVEIELEEPASRREIDAKIEIVIGKVALRLERNTVSTRMAEIVTALERGA